MKTAGVPTMDKPQDAVSPGFPGDLLRPYRPGQGPVARRIALAVGLGFAAWAAFDLWVWLSGFPSLGHALLGKPLDRIPLGGPAISGALLLAVAVGIGAAMLVLWLLRRPWLADLFIDTEAEMKKVSWPAKEEAWGATKVVSATVLVITVVLLIFDLVLTEVLHLITGLRI